MALISCDTFVCLPPRTANNCVIFGKNSDRPSEEVQEIVYESQATYGKGTKLKCTYIIIDQVETTNAVVLSKPSWMWGAEMGSNNYSVCIGNEAVWTHLNSDKEDLTERLLGMDLVRLGLERGRSAKEALDVMTRLLEEHGQGGPCSDAIRNWAYHNSYLIADRKEAWVLETAGRLWAAEKISSGWRNISNSLSIGTKIDLMSPGLKDEAKSLGLWNGKGDFNFTLIFSSGGDSYRYGEGGKLMEKYSKENSFDLKSMMKILRDEDSGICMGCGDSFTSTSSQVSVLYPTGSSLPDCHWFTGTPDPQYSVFKPFIFYGEIGTVKLTTDISSPILADHEDPAKVQPRFKKKVDRRHPLYIAHQGSYSKQKKSRDGATLRQSLRDLENRCMHKVEDEMKNFNPHDENKVLELSGLFNHAVEAELKLYEQ